MRRRRLRARIGARCLIAQRSGDGHIRIYLAFRMAQNGFADLGIAFDDHVRTRAAATALFDGRAPAIVELVHACDEPFVPRPIAAIPVGVRWPSAPAVTVIGDAAHLMSPFAGAGANLAMQDGTAFARAVLAADEPRAAIAAYEPPMFARAEREARESADGLALCIAPDGARALARQMQRFADQAHDA